MCSQPRFVCRRIKQSTGDAKLAAWYLLDSIVKNVKGYYVERFALNLPSLACRNMQITGPHGRGTGEIPYSNQG